MRSPGTSHHDVFLSETPINTLCTTVFHGTFKIVIASTTSSPKLSLSMSPSLVFPVSIKQEFYFRYKVAPVIGVTCEITQGSDDLHVPS